MYFNISFVINNVIYSKSWLWFKRISKRCRRGDPVSPSDLDAPGGQAPASS